MASTNEYDVAKKVITRCFYRAAARLLSLTTFTLLPFASRWRRLSAANQK